MNFDVHGSQLVYLLGAVSTDYNVTVEVIEVLVLLRREAFPGQHLQYLQIIAEGMIMANLASLDNLLEEVFISLTYPISINSAPLKTGEPWMLNSIPLSRLEITHKPP